MAENQREHFVEHNREKQYMHSMMDDLQTDMQMLEKNIKLRKSRLQMIDSLVMMISVPGLNGNANQVYYYARNISPPANIFSTDGTIQQLKSAGNLRLIRNRDIANSILAYDQEIRQAFFEMGDEIEIRAEYRQLASKLFNTRIFFDMQQGEDIVMPSTATALFSNDPMLINQFVGAAQYMKRVHTAQLVRSEKLKSMAGRLLEAIREKY
jgi:hypothetical protein